MYCMSPSLSLPPSCSVDREVTQPFYLTHQPHSNDPLVSTETCCRLKDSSLSVEAGQGWSHQHVQRPSALMRSKALRWYKLIVSLELWCLLASGWAVDVIKLYSWLSQCSGSRSSWEDLGIFEGQWRVWLWWRCSLVRLEWCIYWIWTVSVRWCPQQIWWSYTIFSLNSLASGGLLWNLVQKGVCRPISFYLVQFVTQQHSGGYMHGNPNCYITIMLSQCL